MIRWAYGFHRYATDESWLLPHFEKMLYDQAMIAYACIEAVAAGAGQDIAQIARDTFTYVLRDMTDSEGGFYCAEDADSEGVEGKFYVWREAEIDEILGRERGKLYRRTFNFKPNGNFHDEATGQLTGENIPHLKDDIGSDSREPLEEARLSLFQIREARVHPLKDDKILTDWNGLMIAALAKAAAVLKEPVYAEAATKAADFVLDRLSRDGRLLKRYRKGKAGLPGLLDDYAFFIWGLLELYSATYDSRWLAQIHHLIATAIELFHDEESGAFFTSSTESEQLIMRDKKIYDGAIPSGNSVMAVNLIQFARLTGESRFEEIGVGILEAFSAPVISYPSMSNYLLCALDTLLAPSSEVVIVGNRRAEDTQAMLAAVGFNDPYRVVLLKDVNDEEFQKWAPFTQDMTMIDNKATAYLCHNFACSQPVNDLASLKLLLVSSK